MPGLETWELLSYVVTVVGLPFAIAVFLWEQRKERQGDEEELHQRLAERCARVTLMVAGLPLAVKGEGA